MRRLVGCLVLSLAWQSASAGPEREFWGWFEANAERLAARPQAVETLEDMSFWLGRIDPGLSYEIVAGGRKADSGYGET